MKSDVSIKNQVLMALVDNHIMSKRKVQSYLNIALGQVTSVFQYLIRKNYVRHAGYSRYEITDLGKEEIGKHMSIAQESVEVVEPSEPVEEIEVKTMPVAPKVDHNVNWQQAYVDLAMKIADKVGGNNHAQNT